uniref:Uncharacterized protein n=1 Tax=Caenorhabditis japonica TaxID=281687 RepID=A0A8R1IYZ4_CAEJA
MRSDRVTVKNTDEDDDEEHEKATHPSCWQMSRYEPLWHFLRQEAEDRRGFSIAEAHAWLHNLLPNVPSKCPPADTITNNYQCAVNGELNHDSIDHCLKLIDPKITSMLTLETQKLYAAALKELESNNDDIYSFLSPANAKILRDHDEIYANAEGQFVEDSGVLAILENLLLARAKLTGKSTRGKMEAIKELISSDYSLQNMQKFFKNAAND